MNTIKPFPTRLPPDLRSYLEDKANFNKRSLNNELVDRLEVTKVIETITHSDLREIINDILKLDSYKKELESTRSELIKLKDSYDALKNELAKAFSLSGDTNGDIARMKMERALNHITSGIEELRTIFPQKK
ncbi:MAG: Arc family DNA-binding protein [Candidatus Schmidhempelia sp.]|nr:Arc family DNA-binding protein [Candidatus Schmidhempelia sp.]